jgi:hypothetical protein
MAMITTVEAASLYLVMAGRDPAIHVSMFSVETFSWMPGTSPGMTMD